MQHERVRVGTQFRDNERHPVGHQPRDEVNVAGQPGGAPISPTHKAEDERGEELPDDLAAHREAQQTALELAGTYVNGVVVVRSEAVELQQRFP